MHQLLLNRLFSSSYSLYLGRDRDGDREVCCTVQYGMKSKRNYLATIISVSKVIRSRLDNQIHRDQVLRQKQQTFTQYLQEQKVSQSPPVSIASNPGHYLIMVLLCGNSLDIHRHRRYRESVTFQYRAVLCTGGSDIGWVE